MLLTSAQVAEKLGVSRNYVTNMAKRGLLPSVRGQHPTPSGRTNYGYDAKVVAEFRKTFIPPAPKALKAQPVKLNGHAQELPGLGFTDHVAQRLATIEAKLDALMERVDGKLDTVLGLWK